LTDDPSLSPAAPFRVVNIGPGAPISLLGFIEEIERKLGKKAIRNYMDMQPGDVPSTLANADLLERLTGFRCKTTLREGISAFIEWYHFESIAKSIC
jgi:UDP-glucuronate 4-epimerase